MRIPVDQTPKYHYKLVGEGIEYSWGCAKNVFQQISIKQKRTKQGFRDTVRRCLSTEVLTVDCIRKFSKQAREYMCAYHALTEQQQQQDHAAENLVSSNEEDNAKTI